VKPPRRDAGALSPAGVLGGKAPLRLASQKSRPHAPWAPMRSAPSYFLSKLGVQTRLDWAPLVICKSTDSTALRTKSIRLQLAHLNAVDFYLKNSVLSVQFSKALSALRQRNRDNFESLQILETCTNLRPPPWATLARAPRLCWWVPVP
jgi:hypothetical protein